MCMQRTALDMIITQPDKGGLSEAAILLHRKQCEDTENMQKKINGLETKVDSIEKKVDSILEKLEESPSFFCVLKTFLENKIVQAIIVSTLATVVGSNYIPNFLEFLK